MNNTKKRGCRKSKDLAAAFGLEWIIENKDFNITQQTGGWSFPLSFCLMLKDLSDLRSLLFE